LLLVMLLAGCDKSDLGTTSPVLRRDLPDEISTNVKITEFNRDRVDYILEAARIERFYDRRMLNAYQVNITVFDQKSGETSMMKADTTIVDDARNVIFANGNVLLSSATGSVSSRRMVWDRNIDEITAPGNVILVREGNVLRGENLRTNTRIDYAEMDRVSAEGFFGEEVLDW